MTEKSPYGPFKRCNTCGVEWRDRDSLINDPEVQLLGYQAFIEDEVPGLFMFNHACGTTLAVKLERFRDLYDGPADKFGRIDPPGEVPYCLTSRPEACRGKCECAFVRHVIDILGSGMGSDPDN